MNIVENFTVKWIFNKNCDNGVIFERKKKLINANEMLILNVEYFKEFLNISSSTIGMSIHENNIVLNIPSFSCF